MQRVAVVADHAKAELADDGNLVHGDLRQVDDQRWLGDTAPCLADDLLVTRAAQENDTIRTRLIGNDGEAFGRP